MNDDLISRKAAYKAFSDYLNRNYIGEISSQTELSIGEIASVIKSIPTAFDKEKVKEQIQIFRSKFECTCCPKNIGKHIPVSCDECMDTFAKANIVIVEKGGIE